MVYAGTVHLLNVIHSYFVSRAAAVDLGTNIFGNVSPKWIRALVSLVNERIYEVVVDLVFHFVLEIVIIGILF